MAKDFPKDGNAMRKILVILLWTLFGAVISGCGSTITSTSLPTPSTAITRTKTNAPLVTPSRTVLPTITKAIAVTPTTTITPTYPVNEQVLIFPDEEGWNVYDKQGILLTNLKIKGRELSASQQSCQFFTGSSDLDGNIKINLYDLLGYLIEQREFTIELQKGQKYIYDVKVNQTGDWMVYLVPSGKFEMDPKQSEFLDLQILSMQQGAKPIQITKGHASADGGYDWLPDGRSLVYSERDYQDVPQIFQYFVETGDVVQLTQFNPADGIYFSRIKVSPNGNNIAFLGFYFTDGDKKYYHKPLMGVIDLNTRQINWMDLPSVNTTKYFDTLWWSNDGLHLLSTLPGYPETCDSVIWVDAQSGEIVHTFSDAKICEVCRLFPLDDIDRVGVTGCWYEDFWYDQRTQKMVSTDWPDWHPDTDISIIHINTGEKCAQKR